MAGAEAVYRLVMLGAPGSGKGTQAAILASRLGLPPVSTGDMLRAAVAAGSELGGRVREIMVSGALVDDVTMQAVVCDRLSREDARQGFVLDGYPRTIDQAETLERILGDRGEALDAVLFIAVPEHVLTARALAREREDDREEVVRERLRVYREKTEPLIGYYRERRLLMEVDGDHPVERVTSAILTALEVGV